MNEITKKEIVKTLLEINTFQNWYDAIENTKIYTRDDELDIVSYHFKDENVGLRADYYQSLFDLENMRPSYLITIWKDMLDKKLLDVGMYFPNLDYVVLPKSLTITRMKKICNRLTRDWKKEQIITLKGEKGNYHIIKG